MEALVMSSDLQTADAGERELIGMNILEMFQLI